MKRGVFVLVVVLMGCHVSKQGKTDYLISANLDFKECGSDLRYEQIKLKIPKGFKQNKFIDEHGFCEYRFSYRDESILYVSSNIYDGSSLNFKNRLNAGISTYSNNRGLNDSIVHYGKGVEGMYWMEWVGPDFAMGYLNMQDSVVADSLFHEIVLFD